MVKKLHLKNIREFLNRYYKTAMRQKIVHGKIREEHDMRLMNVCNILRNNALVMNDRKCKIGKQEIDLMGFKIKGYGPLE